MEIIFDWKFSLDEMPEKDENIVIMYKHVNVEPNVNIIVRGTFKGEDYVWEYGRDNFVLGLIGREILFKKTLTFGPELIYDLPLSGFYWDRFSLSYNLPNQEKRKVLFN